MGFDLLYGRLATRILKMVLFQKRYFETVKICCSELSLFSNRELCLLSGKVSYNLDTHFWMRNNTSGLTVSKTLVWFIQPWQIGCCLRSERTSQAKFSYFMKFYPKIPYLVRRIQWIYWRNPWTHRIWHHLDCTRNCCQPPTFWIYRWVFAENDSFYGRF